MAETKFELSNMQAAVALTANREEAMRYLSHALGVGLRMFGDALHATGEEDALRRAESVLKILLQSDDPSAFRKPYIDFVTALVDAGEADKLPDYTRPVTTTAKGRPVRCKTLGQAQYVRAIRSNSIVFGIGPAGTGKTYLAVALAAVAYKNKQVEKIILTRPAVEAGEKLGFLPGDLGAKVDPYLRPLYDALQEMFGTETYLRLVEKGIIEIAPLAYMRGRTLSDAFIILDEAQNATREQMKMFLTRMGENSKIVVTGDATQIDLPGGARSSGLLHAAGILENVNDIAIVRLHASDVVRHDLVQAIVRAYVEDARKRETADDANADTEHRQ